MHRTIANSEPFRDPRKPVEKVRRSALWLILRHYNIPCSQDMPATTMREMAEQAGIDVMKVDFAKIMANRKKELREQIWPETPVAPIPKPDARPGLNPDPTPRKRPLNEYQELVKACKDLGIKLSRRDKKEDLVRKLEDYRDGQDAPERSQ